MSIKTYTLQSEDTVYRIDTEYFKSLKPKEKYISNRFKDLTLDFSRDMSYRRAANRLNRIRLKDNNIKARSICNIVEKEGQSIQDYLTKESEEILLNSGFTSDGDILSEENDIMIDPKDYHNENEINEAILENKLVINDKYIDSTLYEKSAFNVSLDDVCVKKQKEKRNADKNPKAKKQIRETVVNIQKSEKKIILNGDSICKTLKFVLAVILNSGFKYNSPIVFFVDGERKLRDNILTMFNWSNYKIILDWPHLGKKCREYLSMSIINSKRRNNIIEKISPLLWNGDVDAAINYLENIKKDYIKNDFYINKLISYFERNKDYIPCYSLRKALNLRNSSNLGEKSNDLIVSDRQKKNGMSWSLDGSTSLASVSALYKNNQSMNWIRNGKINLSLSEEAA